ncbi:MAG TPA: nicotinate-nucleotide adenylyltransferase [Solirubrobacteraceae bacterium]|nr:nicotinate-nucleotide adenylyltransferase [Solirubrobacteraceae bacterium]
MARIGILGGSFNPPHLAHLVCASEAAAQLHLTRVLLTPVAQPPHKEAERDPGAQERLELCRLAVAGDERLGVCDLEVRRGGPSYTVDTLRALHEHAPEDDLTFIVGGDIALGLPSWREPETVLELATLAVAARDGVVAGDVAAQLRASFPDAPPPVFFDMPRLDISSSQIRRRVAENRSIRYLVPEPVAEHIARGRLYR